MKNVTQVLFYKKKLPRFKGIKKCDLRMENVT